MFTPRLRARTPSAMPVGRARLDGRRLAFHKVGRDGSGKCDVPPDAGGCVHGVLFRLAEAELALLDAFEGCGAGYERQAVRVMPDAGGAVTALTYVATRIDARLRPFDWYLRHVLAGAREHGLPADYVAGIDAVLAVRDPDAARRRRELQVHAGDGGH